MAHGLRGLIAMQVTRVDGNRWRLLAQTPEDRALLDAMAQNGPQGLSCHEVWQTQTVDSFGGCYPVAATLVVGPQPAEGQPL